MKASIAERITAGYAELTPQEQRAADVVMAHLDDLAVYSSAELAEVAGVSRATFSRLYRHLGFESSQEVKSLARERRAQGVPVATVEGERAPGDIFDGHLRDEHLNMAAAFGPENRTHLPAAAAAVASTRRVLVLGWRNSYPVALHLRTQLQQIRDGVAVAPTPGQTVAEELTGLGPQDVVVVLGFRRRPRGFEEALKGCAEAQVPLILIADPSARHLAHHARHWIECPVGRSGAFDSYAAAFSTVAWLADAVLAAGGATAAGHVDRATELFETLRELDLG